MQPGTLNSTLTWRGRKIVRGPPIDLKRPFYNRQCAVPLDPFPEGAEAVDDRAGVWWMRYVRDDSGEPPFCFFFQNQKFKISARRATQPIRRPWSWRSSSALSGDTRDRQRKGNVISLAGIWEEGRKLRISRASLPPTENAYFTCGCISTPSPPSSLPSIFACGANPPHDRRRRLLPPRLLKSRVYLYNKRTHEPHQPRS